MSQCWSCCLFFMFSLNIISAHFTNFLVPIYAMTLSSSFFIMPKNWVLVSALQSSFQTSIQFLNSHDLFCCHPCTNILLHESKLLSLKPMSMSVKYYSLCHISTNWMHLWNILFSLMLSSFLQLALTCLNALHSGLILHTVFTFFPMISILTKFHFCM